MPSLRQPARQPLLRSVARLLIAAFIFALLPPLRAEASVLAPTIPASLPLREIVSAAAEEGCLVVVVIVFGKPAILTKSTFGELLSHTGSDPQPYTFAGEPFDPNSGFSYNRARWMDPRAGRFLGMDEYGGRIEDPATLHKYLYVAGNPANLRDPSGHDGEGGLLGQTFTMAAAVTLGAIALLSYAASVQNAQGQVSQQTMYYALLTMALAAAEMRAHSAALSAQQSYHMSAAVVTALPIMLEAFQKWRQSEEFKNRPGKHWGEFWWPSGPQGMTLVPLRQYQLANVYFTEYEGGDAGRVFQFVYGIGSNPVPGRGLFKFRLDYLDFTTNPPGFNLHYHLFAGPIQINHAKLD